MQQANRLQEVIRAIGQPAFQAPGVLIYNADSLAAMPRLPRGVFDLTITSPPYNIGKEYETTLPLSDYLEWTANWITQVYRLTSAFGAFWLNLGYIEVPGRGRAVPLPYLIWDKVPFYLLQEIVWNYGAGVAARRMFSPRNEKYLWYVKSGNRYTFNLDEIRDPDVKYPNQKKNGRLRVNPIGKNPTDVWQIPKVTTGEGLVGRRASKERTAHPAQFPEAIIDKIVKGCSNPGDLILDPFVGSGTTAKVALSNHRLVVGFDLNPAYIEIATRRITKSLAFEEQSQAQPKLFEQAEGYSSINL